MAAGPIEQKRAEASALASRLDQQARQIVGLDRRYRQAADRVAGAESAVDQARTELEAVERRHVEVRAKLVGDAQLAYALGGPTRMLNLSSPGGSPEAISRAAYLRLVSGRERQSLGTLRVVREDLADQRSRLDRARSVARAEAGAAGRERSASLRAVNAQRSLLSQVNGQLASLVKQEQARRDAAADARRRALQSASAGGVRAPAASSRTRPVPRGTDIDPGVIDDVFMCIRQLESGNRYGSVGGGAYQFQDATWQSLGYSGTARDASPEMQDEAARRLQARDGWRPWTTAPLCGRP